MQPDDRPARKRPGESWESLADRRVREAMAAGEFENLPGFGKPIPGIDSPLDENWWIRDKLKREEISALPPILEARKLVEKTLEELPAIASETEVRRRLATVNEEIQRAHFSHEAGPADGIRRLDVERVVAEWKQRRESSTSAGEGERQ
jgi:DnaJ homologue, subfamily C, member 28, conserved domain